MNCKKPFFPGGLVSYPCGQCLPCRINKRRLWAHRLVLESMLHGDNCVATLTYDQDHEPPGRTLRKEDLQLYLKRIREGIRPRKIRFFACGEYGDTYERPHYHVALFGMSALEQPYLLSKWPHGFIYVDSLTPESAAYICGYVTKKMTSKEDPRLNGRSPEFSRMSLRPGIAAPLMAQLASQCTDRETARAIGTSMDVPTVLQHGKKRLPLGRYLRHRLRAELFGTTDTREPEAHKLKKAKALHDLCTAIGTAAAVDSLKLQSEPVRVLQTETRFQIRKQGKL